MVHSVSSRGKGKREESRSNLLGIDVPHDRFSKREATKLGVSIEDYLKAKALGQRYCRVHGLQDLKGYNVTGKKETHYQCKKCAADRKKTHPEVYSRLARERSRRVRREVLEHYSPDLVCSICGEGHYEFLCLDHINGGGAEHRRSRGDFYWVSFKREGWPSGFRVLCYNCNLKHGCRDFYGTGAVNRKISDDPSELAAMTPRERASVLFRLRHPDKMAEHVKKAQVKLKADVMLHYGGKCACCGTDDLEVLSIDHINNDGATHRRELRARGERFSYNWLKKNGYPPGFQPLCMNCNSAKGHWGECPHCREGSSVGPSERPVEYLRTSEASSLAHAARRDEGKREKAIREFSEAYTAIQNSGPRQVAAISRRLGISQGILTRILRGTHWSCRFLVENQAVDT
jgi:hypothetical protein